MSTINKILISVGVLVVIGLVCFSYLPIQEILSTEGVTIRVGSTIFDWINLAVSTFSLIFIFWYVIDTHKMAVAATDSLRPIISLRLISGSKYYGVRSESNPDLAYDTRCIVTNHSKYVTDVFVNLNLKIDGIKKEVKDVYSGEISWSLQPFKNVNGHFSLKDYISDIEGVEEITIDIEVSYKSSSSNKLYKHTAQRWYFNKENKMWRNEIGVTV